MIRVTILSICILLSSFSYGQSSSEKIKIKDSIVGFLNWFKKNGNSIEKRPIVTGFNATNIKGDSVVKVNMSAVDEYLANLKKSNYVSDLFLVPIKIRYKEVSDALLKSPLIDYFGPIGGLESDPIFGFEPAQILDHINEGRFTKIYILYDKAIVKFDIPKLNQSIFTLTKIDEIWLIDYFGADRTNFDRK